jgi:alcohol oxidase
MDSITGTEVTDAPDFNTGFLSDPDDIDLKMQIWAYKKQREIARRLSTYRGELELGHPRFPEGSQAALVDETGGCTRFDLPPIQYGKEDDKAIEEWIRENLNTTWHSSRH